MSTALVALIRIKFEYCVDLKVIFKSMSFSRKQVQEKNSKNADLLHLLFALMSFFYMGA